MSDEKLIGIDRDGRLRFASELAEDEGDSIDELVIDGCSKADGEWCLSGEHVFEPAAEALIADRDMWKARAEALADYNIAEWGDDRETWYRVALEKFGPSTEPSTST